jgi:hypothetical protein
MQPTLRCQIQILKANNAHASIALTLSNRLFLNFTNYALPAPEPDQGLMRADHTSSAGSPFTGCSSHVFASWECRLLDARAAV